MNIKQREDEMLISYITRFNKEALSIDEADDKILVTVFTNGLWKGSFCFPYTRTTQKSCRMYFTRLLSTWMRKTHY